MQQFSTIEVDNKHLMNYIDATIPVMEDLVSIAGNWNGKDQGEVEDQSLLAGEIIELLDKAGKKLAILNKL